MFNRLNEVYHIPSAIDESVAKIIVEQLKSVELSDAQIIGDDKAEFAPDKRKSKITFIPTDHWVSGMMAHFIQEANLRSFNFKLTGWADKIQYTVYDNPGSHYTWHTDIAESKLNCFSDHPSTQYRKLSISLCLTSDFEGGQLQLLTSDDDLIKTNLKCGDAIIFPSTMKHRVTRIKSGTRISLVGWYAGPMFQ